MQTTLTESQFIQLSKLVYKESGINLKDNKKSLLQARLAKRLRATNTSSISEYIKLLADDPIEYVHFIDGVTTNHTYFFRENKHIEFILDNVGPDRHLKIWSAASSSGEEAYSIAIQLYAKSYSFSIIGSDISDTMLETASKGIYPIERAKSIPLPILHRYFKKGKNSFQNYIKIKDEIKQFVSFKKFNLVTDITSEKFDIIFLRNVMIYFDLKTKQRVVDHIRRALKEGGYFIIGQSENLLGITAEFKTVSPSIYLKV